jgi:hypothetical protein
MRPPATAKYHYSNGSTRKVLLTRKILISGDENLKTILLCGRQKLAIFQRTLTELACKNHFVRRQVHPERLWSALIEKNFH